MEQRNVLSPGEAGPLSLTPETIARRLADGLNPLGRSDAALEAALAGAPAPGAAVGLDRDPTPAAVLVPLVEHGSGMTVLLTQRTAHLANHPGQISFPAAGWRTAIAATWWCAPCARPKKRSA